jgi:RNA polymerase sigma-70 factor (ECF subfamily)
MAGSAASSSSLSAAIAGDLSALEAVLRDERPRVLTYIQRHFPPELKRLLEPQDILQDTLFQAARAMTAFQPEGEDCVYRWLVTIARARMLKMVAARRTLKRGGGQTRGDSVAILMAELAIDELTPSRVMAGEELARTIEQCIRNLPTDYAEVVRLRHVDALPVADVAARMGRTEHAVHMLWNRAMKALRKEIRSATRFV